MTSDPDDARSDDDPPSESLMEVVLKPIVMSVLLLLTPIQILAGASPILVPLLFLMSRRDSVDRGWQRAGLVGVGLTVLLTAFYLLSVTSGG